MNRCSTHSISRVRDVRWIRPGVVMEGALSPQEMTWALMVEQWQDASLQFTSFPDVLKHCSSVCDLQYAFNPDLGRSWEKAKKGWKGGWTGEWFVIQILSHSPLYTRRFEREEAGWIMQFAFGSQADDVNILVGVRNDGTEDVTLEVIDESCVACTALSRIVVPAGQASLLLGDNAVPVMNNKRLAWGVQLWVAGEGSPPEVRVAGAWLIDSPLRAALRRSPWVARGVDGRVTSSVGDGWQLQLPRARHWRAMVRAKKMLQDAYWGELMARACHPSRLTQIGMDSESERDD